MNAERFFEQEADEGDSEEEFGGKSKQYKKDIKDAYYNEGELKKRTKRLDLQELEAKYEEKERKK